MKQILWGLFKKVIIADQCAVYVNSIFDNYATCTGSTLALGAILFSFQIYGDFSGYSDIAIGTARLFGIDLLRNFSYPYFSRDVAEFWRRWHISLTSWFKDYLYIPLGGNKGSTWLQVRNILIVFLVSAFWHGADWTFVFWGIINAFYIIPSIILKTNRTHLNIVAAGKTFPNLKDFASILFTFGLTTFAWIFFRSSSLSNAISYIAGIFNHTLFSSSDFFEPKLALTILAFVIIEWLGREQPYAIAGLGQNWYRAFRWSFYITLLILIFCFVGTDQRFIYFQF